MEEIELLLYSRHHHNHDPTHLLTLKPTLSISFSKPNLDPNHIFASNFNPIKDSTLPPPRPSLVSFSISLSLLCFLLEIFSITLYGGLRFPLPPSFIFKSFRVLFPPFSITGIVTSPRV